MLLSGTVSGKEQSRGETLTTTLKLAAAFCCRLTLDAPEMGGETVDMHFMSCLRAECLLSQRYS